MNTIRFINYEFILNPLFLFVKWFRLFIFLSLFWCLCVVRSPKFIVLHRFFVAALKAR